MDNEHRAYIIKNIDFIASNLIDLSRLLNLFLEKSVLSTLEVELIKSKSVNYECGTELVYSLIKKDQECYPTIIECLIESGNQAIAKRLQDNSKNPQTKYPLWFNIKKPTKFFVGREREIKKIENVWLESRLTGNLLFVAVTGLGGVGKSELARNYTKLFYENVKGHCIWLDAETNQTLRASISTLAEKEMKLSLYDKNGNWKSDEELYGEIFVKLFQKECFFIFDNLEDFGHPIIKALCNYCSSQPPSSLIPFVMTTSRFNLAKSYFGTKCTQLELNVLGNLSAIEFFKKSFKLNEDMANGTLLLESIDKLCERLQYYPLGMHQAVAYINENLIFNPDLIGEVQNYLIEIDKESKKLLDHKLPQYESLEKTSSTTYLTWRTTIDKLEATGETGRSAIQILNIIAFLSSDNISFQTVAKYLESNGDFENSDVYYEGLRLLRTHSMISLFRKKSISVHRLVQEVTRLDLEAQGKFTIVLDMLLQSTQKLLTTEEIPSDQMINLEVLWQFGMKNAKLIAKHSGVAESICRRLEYLGKYNEGYNFICGFINDVIMTFGDKSRLSLMARCGKGIFLKRMGRYRESLKMLKDVFEIQKKSFGDSDDHCLLTAKEIAVVLICLDKPNEAIKWLESSLEKRILTGENSQTSHEVLLLRTYLAEAFRGQRKYEVAFRMYSEVLEVRQSRGEENHASTLGLRHDMAIVRFRQEKYEDALRILKEVVEMKEKVLDLNHSDTLGTKHWIAKTHKSLGNIEEGFTIATDVLEKQIDNLGPSHPHTIITRHLLNEFRTQMHNKNVSSKHVKCTIF